MEIPDLIDLRSLVSNFTLTPMPSMEIMKESDILLHSFPEQQTSGDKTLLPLIPDQEPPLELKLLSKQILPLSSNPSDMKKKHINKSCDTGKMGPILMNILLY